MLERADRAATRERMYRARDTVGGAPNLALLGELGRLRREYAQLFGYASYGDFVLRRRMALNVANAQRFLDEVKAAVGERERRELEELRQATAQQLELPADAAATRLDRWDVAYNTERVRRKRYSVDQEAFRPYFPPQRASSSCGHCRTPARCSLQPRARHAVAP